MKRPGIIVFNLLILLGYSTLFTLAYPLIGDPMIGVHWAAVGLHILYLMIIGIVRMTAPETKKAGGQMLLASLLVAIIGHGLCFFNGLVHFGGVH